MKRFMNQKYIDQNGGSFLVTNWLTFYWDADSVREAVIEGLFYVQKKFSNKK